MMNLGGLTFGMNTVPEVLIRLYPSVSEIPNSSSAGFSIQWTPHTESRLSHHMEINLRGFDAIVPHERLNRPDIGAPIQQV